MPTDGGCVKFEAEIVCRSCKGSGCEPFSLEYEPFWSRRSPPDGVCHVYAANPGIVCAPSVVPGGVPLAVWERRRLDARKPGAEMREHTCPAWWYQTADYEKKPDWDECALGRRFSDCTHFARKAACWDRWDAEFASATEADGDG